MPVAIWEGLGFQVELLGNSAENGFPFEALLGHGGLDTRDESDPDLRVVDFLD